MIKKWELNDEQAKSMSDLLGRFGASLDDVTESQLKEKAEPLDYAKMTSAEIEDKTHVVAIDKSILDGIDEFVKLGMDAKDWYNDMNIKIMSALGESDGCLFLILMALFSPRNTLAQNFRLAAQTYVGLKKDLADPKLEKLLSQLLEEDDTYTAIRGLQGFNVKALAAKYGMRPQELQEILWVAVLRKTKGENYTSTFENAIQKNLTRLKIGKEEMENVDNFFSKVISVVGGA